MRRRDDQKVFSFKLLYLSDFRFPKGSIFRSVKRYYGFGEVREADGEEIQRRTTDGGRDYQTIRGRERPC